MCFKEERSTEFSECIEFANMLELFARESKEMASGFASQGDSDCEYFARNYVLRRECTTVWSSILLSFHFRASI